MAVGSPVIDPIDARIIDVLRDDARMSWRALGERVSLSPSAVADRVRRLEELGVIQGYTVRVDPAALGRTVRAVVDVSLAPGEPAEAFEARLAERVEVTFAAWVTGTADYSVTVECEGAEGLDAFVRWLRADAGVARTESRLVLRTLQE